MKTWRSYWKHLFLLGVAIVAVAQLSRGMGEPYSHLVPTVFSIGSGVVIGNFIKYRRNEEDRKGQARRGPQEGDERRAVTDGASEAAAPRQPRLTEASATPRGAAVTAHPRRRPLFRWVALAAAVVMSLGIAGSVAAERDPQVDLTVVAEDAQGRCTVTWSDPWSGDTRRGPFRCDPGRDPILSDWETGFVVSYGPWKGDLYNADLEGTSANAVNDWLLVVGFLVLVGSGVAGGVRVARRAAERRLARDVRVSDSPRARVSDVSAECEGPPREVGESLLNDRADPHTGPPDHSSRGRRPAVVGYGLITLLCAAATWWAVTTGLARLDLLEDVVRVRITECHMEGGGRGGSRIVCSGPQLDTTATRTVTVSYDGRKGEVIRAVRKPWGGYEAVDRSLVSWGVAVLFPVLPLCATGGAGALTVREVRRVRREVSASS
ncbi:hypothetical protein [Streptomyces sp. NPDC012510]|uniref:hypothetical protein n=1 Tax=Streptomyces sp. NPDC012510 TaxID=3364838 RepID=UPI0036E74983